MKSLLSILVIVVSVGVYFVYIKPLTVEVKVQMAQKAEIDRVLNRVKEIKEKRDAVFLDYNSISLEEIEKLNKILPETINSVVILNDLSTLAAQYGLTIKDYKVDNFTIENNAVSEGETVEPYKETKLTLKLIGSYNQFVTFISKVESSLRLMDIVHLGIKQGGGGPANLLEYTLEVNVYSLK